MGWPCEALNSHTPPRCTTLPENTALEAQLAYDGATRILTLSMYQVGGGGSLTLLDTELVPLDLDAFGSSYDPAHSFEVNTLSIMAYHDGFTTAEDPSLVADVTFDSIALAVVPEPSSWCLAIAALAGLAVTIRRRKALVPGG